MTLVGFGFESESESGMDGGWWGECRRLFGCS